MKILTLLFPKKLYNKNSYLCIVIVKVFIEYPVNQIKYFRNFKKFLNQVWMKEVFIILVFY